VPFQKFLSNLARDLYLRRSKWEKSFTHDVCCWLNSVKSSILKLDSLLESPQARSSFARFSPQALLADVCWRMLTYADVCWRMLTDADSSLPKLDRALLDLRPHTLAALRPQSSFARFSPLENLLLKASYTSSLRPHTLAAEGRMCRGHESSSGASLFLRPHTLAAEGLIH
jgi:hypothetical protein